MDLGLVLGIDCTRLQFSKQEASNKSDEQAILATSSILASIFYKVALLAVHIIARAFSTGLQSTFPVCYASFNAFHAQDTKLTVLATSFDAEGQVPLVL